MLLVEADEAELVHALYACACIVGAGEGLVVAIVVEELGIEEVGEGPEVVRVPCVVAWEGAVAGEDCFLVGGEVGAGWGWEGGCCESGGAEAEEDGGF